MNDDRLNELERAGADPELIAEVRRLQAENARLTGGGEQLKPTRPTGKQNAVQPVQPTGRPLTVNPWVAAAKTARPFGPKRGR